MKTTQELFDTVATHLLTQNEKAVSYATGSCRYRAKNDKGKVLFCAVGCLIPAELYNSGIETQSAAAMPVIKILFAAGVLGHETLNTPELYQSEYHAHGYNSEAVQPLRLLLELQGIHDSRDPGDWPRELRKLAETFSLSPEVLNKLESAHA